MDEQHQVSDLNELSPLVLLNDEPTPDHEADGLKMRAYAEVIAGAALGTIGPFTIGVFGKWGTGKSSILRQAKSLVELANPGALCVWFNAWQYDHEPHPLVPMALEIAAGLDARIAHEKGTDTLGQWIRWREIGVALRAVASGLTVKTPVLDVRFKEILDEFDRGTGDVASPLQPGVYQKAFSLLRDVSAMDAAASRENRRPPIVVFVDDLDRCLPSHALRLLQAIRLALSQPGFFFVLALDQDPVVHYLARYYESLGMKQPQVCARSYLEKMIQLPLWIPPHESRFSDFMAKLLAREELTHHPDVRNAIGSLSALLKVGTEANPRALVRLINSLIADRLLWIARGKDVNAEWLGFCAISRVLRDKLGDEPYRTLVYADVSCSWLAQTPSPDELDKRRQKYIARGEGLSRLESDELKWLSPIVRSAAVRALLETKIGKGWLTNDAARHAIEGYLASERRDITATSTAGVATIERKIRKTLSLSPEVPITDAHRNRIRELDLTFESVRDPDLLYIASMPSLRSLRLFDTEITDNGLVHLKDMRSLTLLDLSSTAITTDGLRHLAGVSSLTTLLLWGIRVTDAGLLHVKRLSALHTLNLWDTAIGDRHLEALNSLSLLRTLILRGTDITDTGLVSLRGLTSLAELDLGDTEVTDRSLHEVSSHTGLTALALDGTHITDTGLLHIKALQSLSHLDLSSTHITDDGLLSLSDLPHLVSLVLRETRITDTGLKVLQDCSSLTELDLCATKITDSGLQFLRRLPSLTTLKLSKTPITDEGLRHLAPLVALTRLDLNGTRITDASIAQICNMSSLQSLVLHHTGVSASGKRELQDMLPKLTVW